MADQLTNDREDALLAVQEDHVHGREVGSELGVGFLLVDALADGRSSRGSHGWVSSSWDCSSSRGTPAMGSRRSRGENFLTKAAGRTRRALWVQGEVAD